MIYDMYSMYVQYVCTCVQRVCMHYIMIYNVCVYIYICDIYVYIYDYICMSYLHKYIFVNVLLGVDGET